MSARREWLKQGAALGASLALPLKASAQAPQTAAPAAPTAPTTAAKPAPAPLIPAPAASAAPLLPGRPWQNWSGIERCAPANWLIPADEGQLAATLATSKGSLRCVGAGHSFTGLVPTEGTLISLDKLSGIVALDRANSVVRVRAGTRLNQLARELDAQGLALYNQPDIDVQTVAGALSTATHGTGLTLPALHAEVQALRLITVQGEALECSRFKNPELFDAARVSLGALGVISEFSLRVRPRHLLRRKVWLSRTEALLEQAPELARAHRHFEFYVLPFTGYSAAITHDEVQGAPQTAKPAADEDMLRDLRRLRDWLGRWPELRRWTAAKLIDPAMTESAQDWSWKLLSTVRPTRFNESEFHLPRETALTCLKEVIATLERRNEVFFPMEFRFVRADHAWLSPFFERDSCSIAAHAAQGEAHDYLVSDLAPIFRRHGGRPHWGKLHGLKSADLAALYPRYADFRQQRERLDPQGRLLNRHLRQLFEGQA
ncbi:D-arabinono-1,4-lactone oxidase [Paucibacter sp. APW11]|uniref:D-arabinono-1,4-lactone oxidase n=1 Tax=Roseateles aquae TaxID=3077235 RepID=A0ABU3PDJ1_9BURK|nr:D-arabinono-1,4-lactone oxidase [Paucibacter sp. APW11]MDT9000666.1 D-arabinono-1,4-lactone oxidase [Paucibacter sp. APW11]